MTLTRRAETLRVVAERLKVEPLKRETAKPGVNEAFRVTVNYHDGRQPDIVATIKRGHGNTCTLVVIYDKPGKALQYEFTIPLERFQALLATLRNSKFDTLDDEPDIPYTGVDLWLIERGSGTFYHDIVLSPSTAKGHHRELVLAIRQHLPEAVRELAI